MTRALCIAMLSCALAEAGPLPGNNQEHLALFQRGRAAHRNGHYAEAETLMLAALKALGGGNGVRRAGMLSELGDVYLSQDALTKAERAYSESLSMYRALADKAAIPLILRNLGAVYSLEQRHDDALRVFEQALKLLKSDSAADPATTAQVLNSVGVAYHRQGKYDKAEKYFHESLQTALTSGASFDIAQVMNNLGAVYYAKRDFQKAEDFLKRALTLTEAAFGPSHPELTFTLSTLGLLYSTTGRYREAEDLYRRSIGILERDKPVFDARIARILHTLSAMYGKAGRKADADAALAEAASIARRQIAQHPDMAVIFEDYAVSLKKEGKGKEAEALRGEARRARTSAGIIIHAHSPF